MKWIKTTLRKGTKSPRICRDMFITDSRGKFQFCQVKNGRIVKKEHLNKLDAENIIKENALIKLGCMFPNCFTYRDSSSTKLVFKLLNN